MSKFQEYVTGQAFALTLSRRMCEALQFVAMDRDAHAALPNIPQLSTMHALEERGLIERNPWRLSQAGRLLYPLLAHAGLVEAGRKPMKKLYCFDTKLDRPHDETEHCADACVAVYLASEVDARIAELEKYKLAVEQHNRECDDLCNNAATCGYKQYFDANGRRCPTCPVDMKINVTAA